MYHFVSEQTPELRLATNVLVSSQSTQYLKSFQLEAVQFIYERLSKHQFCIHNDESGLGKTAAVVALLSALEPAKKKTLIVMQNDDRLLSGWQFHFDILTDLPVKVIQDVKDSTESPHSVYLAKWSVLRNIGDLSRLNFDLVIVDNRGHTLNNSFCTSMLFKHYEKKVNLVISSVDITSETKLLYNILRLGGCLENQYRTYRSFERKFHLADAKEVFQKKIDLEEYYKQRGFLGEYIRDYRLRRYRHQFDQYLPLVSVEHYNNNLNLWLTANNSESTLSGSTLPTVSSSDVRSTAGTDEIMECLTNLKRVQECAQEPEKLSEHSDEVLAMSPLVFEMSEPEEEDRSLPLPLPLLPPPSSQAVFTVSSDDCEMVTPQKTNKRVPSTPTTKRKAKKRLVPLKPSPVEISESEVEIETVKQPSASPVITTKKINIRLRRTTIATPQSGAISKTVSPKSEPKVVKEEAETPSRPMTRGMQRLTRSASARMVSKYMNRNRTTETPKRKPGRRPKRKSLAREIPVPETTTTATPQLLSSSSISSEYLQCAQKVPENLEVLELPGFRVPFTPSPATPNSLLLPSAFNLFSDSDMVVPIVSQKQREIVVVSSSHDDSSHSLPTQSRRTRALKRKRNEDHHHPQATPLSVSSSNFGSLISQQQQQQRQQNKSPDIFSNYSELSQMTLAQPQPFEGFKIFGSEVKQVQQQNAKAKPIGKKRRERSCLDILEQMFEPHRRPEKPANTQVMPTLPRRNLLEDEGDMDIFEITNNREFGSRLRLNSGGNVSPVQQQQTQQASLRSPQQPNKITNYLISSGPTPEERTPTQMVNVRKSPKSIRATQQQTTKLTRWFGATANSSAAATNTQMSSGESTSAPTTPKGPSTSAVAAAAMRVGRTMSRSPTKRKRLDLYK